MADTFFDIVIIGSGPGGYVCAIRAAVLPLSPGGRGRLRAQRGAGRGGMRRRVSDQKRAFAKSLRQRSTRAEQALWQLLRDRRFAAAKFRRQVPVGPWIVDFVSYEHRLIVEADGGQHNESKADVRRDDDLTARGFHVLRYRNNDILGRPQSVLEHLAATIAKSPSPGFAPYGARPPSPTRGEGERARDNG